jgi:hypothetical protein
MVSLRQAAAGPDMESNKGTEFTVMFVFGYSAEIDHLNDGILDKAFRKKLSI